MEVLIGVFAFFALLALAGLVKFQGNPIFVFSLLLCLASLAWLLRLKLDEAPRPRARRKGRRRA